MEMYKVKPAPDVKDMSKRFAKGLNKGRELSGLGLPRGTVKGKSGLKNIKNPSGCM